MTEAALAGRRALVTGAAGGIGFAVARTFVNAGAHVLLTDINPDVTDLASALGMPSAVVDLTDRRAVTDLITAAPTTLDGPLTTLVHAAGILVSDPLSTISDAEWDQLVAVNLTATMAVLRAGLGIVADHGTITVVSSNAAATPRVGLGAYGATKAAVTSLVRSAGLEVAARGVRCNVVTPGSTDTAMLRSMWPADQAPERSTADIIAGSPDAFRLGIPLGRLAAAQDIAASVAFLASDAARHITLHDLRVDGGATLDQ